MPPIDASITACSRPTPIASSNAACDATMSRIEKGGNAIPSCSLGESSLATRPFGLSHPMNGHLDLSLSARYGRPRNIRNLAEGLAPGTDRSTLP
jgi:hypothetical protein